jgi:hypothetical protein
MEKGTENGTKAGYWIAAGAVVVVIAAILMFVYLRYIRHQKPIVIQGAIIVEDADTRERLPIAGVEITGLTNVVVAAGKSDPSGFFTIGLPKSLRRGQALTLQFRQPGYRPVDLVEPISDKLYVVQMTPVTQVPDKPASQPKVTVGSLRVRYSIKAMTTVNIGSAAKPFQVINTGNVPCEDGRLCSPDRKWKAAIGSAFLDAGQGNEFRNARVSCIAGPCPFTKIDKDEFSRGGQTIRVSVRNWSDTTTFLLEAEVFHPMISEVVHESRPVIFGGALDFTLPASAEGVYIEADVDGQTIIYPLGPALFLSWANCDVTVNRDLTKVYRCNLKAGYQFPATAGNDGGGKSSQPSK